MNSVPDEKNDFQSQSQLEQELILKNIANLEPFERFQLYLNWYYDERKWNDHYDY